MLARHLFATSMRACRRYPAARALSTTSESTTSSYRFGMTEADVEAAASGMDASAATLMKQTLDLENASQAEKNIAAIHDAVAKFQRFPGDTGSSEVQVGILTAKIEYMTAHMKKNKQDKHSRRGMEAMIHRRRKLMLHLRKNDFEKYKTVLFELGLKDVVRHYDARANHYYRKPSKRSQGRLDARRERRKLLQEGRAAGNRRR